MLSLPILKKEILSLLAVCLTILFSIDASAQFPGTPAFIPRPPRVNGNFRWNTNRQIDNRRNDNNRNNNNYQQNNSDSRNRNKRRQSENEDEVRWPAGMTSNVLNKDVPENVYFEFLYSFYGNHRDVNWGTGYFPNSLNYKVYTRDNNGLPTIVSGVYQKKNRVGNRMDDSTEIVIYFVNGIPCRQSFPRDQYLYDLPSNKTFKGNSLSFSEDELKIISDFNAEFDSQQKKQFDANSDASLSQLIKKQNEKYPKTLCSSCISKKYTPTTYDREVTKYDERDNPYTVKETSYSNEVEIRNNCDYTVYLIGIKRLYDVKKGYYFEDATVKFGPRQVVEFDINSLGVFFGFYKDINFNSLHPTYNKELRTNDGVQYLRIVGSKTGKK